MKIKPVWKLSVLLVLGIAVYFLVLRLNKPGSDTSENASFQNFAGDRNNAASKANTKIANDGRSFTYTPGKPQKGILKAVVEIGATGFNSFVILLDEKQRWEVIDKNFGSSLVYEGLATGSSIEQGLNNYLSDIFNNAIDKKNIFFLISSGAQKDEKIKTVAEELKKKGYTLQLVTPEEEGKFGLLASVPLTYRASSFLVDIGSGNTKICWQEGSTIKTLEAPGSKYYENKKSDTEVYNQIKELALQIPEANRKTSFIIGGVPFQLAEQTRTGEERYTLLRAPQVYKAANKRMESGLNIYKAITDATQCPTFVFDWDANFTIGFLLNQP